MEVWANLLVDNNGIVVPIVAIFARLSVFIFLLPGIGETSISARIRLTVALVLTWIILPSLWPFPVQSYSAATALQLILKEAAIGLFLGLVLRIMIFTLQILGNIVSQALSISQVLGEGIATEPNTTISTLFMLAGVTLLVSLDIHIEAIGIFIRSYAQFPLGGFLDTGLSARWFLNQTSQAFTFGVTLALPFIILNFIYNLIIGFLNRSMPQLMVSFVGMPAITGAGIILLALSAGVMLSYWLSQYQRLMGNFL